MASSSYSHYTRLVQTTQVQFKEFNPNNAGLLVYSFIAVTYKVEIKYSSFFYVQQIYNLYLPDSLKGNL